jgi:hypothetical protein
LNIETNYLGFSERLVFLVGWNPLKCKEGILGADRIGVCRTKAKALIQQVQNPGKPSIALI